MIRVWCLMKGRLWWMTCLTLVTVAVQSEAEDQEKRLAGGSQADETELGVREGGEAPREARSPPSLTSLMLPSLRTGRASFWAMRGKRPTEEGAQSWLPFDGDAEVAVGTTDGSYWVPNTQNVPHHYLPFYWGSEPNPWGETPLTRWSQTSLNDDSQELSSYTFQPLPYTPQISPDTPLLSPHTGGKRQDGGPFWITRGKRATENNRYWGNNPWITGKNVQEDDNEVMASYSNTDDMLFGKQEGGGPFWINRNKKPYVDTLEEEASPLRNQVSEASRDKNFWVARGKKDDPGTPPFWISRGKRNDENVTSFWIARGKKNDEVPPFWIARGKKVVVHPFWVARGKKEVNPFWVTRGKEEAAARPFWIARGKKEVQPFWVARGKKEEESHPFWVARGKKGETNPFWVSRGKKDGETHPFFLSNGKKQDKAHPFWVARGKKLVNYPYWVARGKKSVSSPYWESQGGREDPWESSEETPVSYLLHTLLQQNDTLLEEPRSKRAARQEGDSLTEESTALSS
nr:uncharacterized protein LOC128704006 isoform X1 [Cherax quadricarinatus]